MQDLLETIRDELKGIHIEDGTNAAFDRVCEQLNDRLKVSSVYSLGVRDGKSRLQDSIKDLLDMQSCDCDT